MPTPVCTVDAGATPALWLVRHGRPLVDAGVCYGATDVAADPLHTAQIAAMLADRLPLGAEVRSSPLQRCLLLAQAVAAARSDLVLRVEPRIAEMDFGCWEGWRWDAIPKPAFDAWTGQFDHHRFGGVESSQDLMHRVAQVWDEARAGTTAQVWITHAGVISAVTLLARGIRCVDRASDWPAQSARYGALVGVVHQACANLTGERD